MGPRPCHKQTAGLSRQRKPCCRRQGMPPPRCKWPACGVGCADASRHMACGGCAGKCTYCGCAVLARRLTTGRPRRHRASPTRQSCLSRPPHVAPWWGCRCWRGAPHMCLWPTQLCHTTPSLVGLARQHQHMVVEAAPQPAAAHLPSSSQSARGPRSAPTHLGLGRVAAPYGYAVGATIRRVLRRPKPLFNLCA